MLVSFLALGALFGILVWKAKTPAILLVNESKNNDSLVALENEWSLHTSIDSEDTSRVIEVTYDQKYGRTVQFYCMAVFENKKENRYKCLAPWIGKKEIERANINDFQTRVVLRSEAPVESFSKEVK